MSHKISVVVDDEPSVRDFIIAVLQGDGFQTIEAEDGVHALELLHKLGGAVDLLVSDIRMPLMDGINQVVKKSFNFFQDLRMRPDHQVIDFKPHNRNPAW